jgi:hypothetical protein
MPNPILTRMIGRAAQRLPGLRALPVMRLVSLAELALLARRHVAKLEPHERRRLIELVRIGRGRRGNLTPEQREEMARLVAKLEPRAFAGQAAARLSPLPLRRRR